MKKFNNAYEMALELNRLDCEMKDLVDSIKKESNISVRKMYMDELDRKLALLLELKHKLQDIKVCCVD